ILINLISQFHEMYPNITFQLFENGSKKIENDIYYGDLDMGITVLPTNNKNFNTFSFLEEKLKLVVHKNHKLSKRKTVNIEDLKEQQFILLNSDFNLNHKTNNPCIDYGFNPNMIFETTQRSFKEETLLNNLGICILPEGILELLANNLKAIDINEPSMK